MPWPKTMRALGSAALPIAEERVVRDYATRSAVEMGLHGKFFPIFVEKVVSEWRSWPRSEQRRAVLRMRRGGGAAA